MQKSSQIQPSFSKLCAGIDVAKDELVCSLVNPMGGELLWQSRFVNNTDGMSRLLAKIPPDARIAIEPTGRYANAFIHQASEQGRTVLLAPGKRSAAYNRSVQPRATTDPISSLGLAMFAYSRPLWPYRLKSEAVERIDQHLIHRRLLSRAIAAMHLQAREMPYAAESVYKAIGDLKSRLADLDKRIASLVQDDEQFAMVAKLKQVPGFGPVSSTALVSRLVHKQFTRPDQFVAYVGLDISVTQSGKRRGQLGLTKDGDAELRRLLYLSAMSAIKVKGSPFQMQYERELAKGHPKISAICAVARKMAKLAWSMVRNNAAYDPNRVYVNNPTKITADTRTPTH